MSSAAEMFIGEQVREAINEKYPALEGMWLKTPAWAYGVWDVRDLPEKFTVELGGEPTTTIEVTVGFDVEGDDSGRYIAAHVAHVKEVCSGKTT